MKKKKKETVGKQLQEFIKRNPVHVDTMDQYKQVFKDIERDLREAIERGKKLFEEDFYIEYTRKSEKALYNMPHEYFIPQEVCPTPFYDQNVYKYHKNIDEIEFLWTVPDFNSCQYFLTNKSKIPPSGFQLLKFVMEFYDGTLLKRAKMLNGEKEDSILLEGTDNKDLRGVKSIVLHLEDN